LSEFIANVPVRYIVQEQTDEDPDGKDGHIDDEMPGIPAQPPN
jgi:hypothetical protein